MKLPIAASLLVLSLPCLAQQTMPMDPGMKMDKPRPQARPTPQPQKPTPDTRPINEPTIPPVPGDRPGPMAMQMHMQPVSPQLPRIGRSISPDPSAGPIYTLEDLEQRALAHNPTLAQARAQVTAAQGVRHQVGLGPNPTVGYYGDEIRGGSFRSGKEGFFLDQTIVTGGKLSLNRKVEDQSIHRAEAESQAQTWRIRNATRQAYYRVLTAQELVNLKQDLAAIAHTSVDYTRELANAGQADATEVLQTEVAEQKMILAVQVQQNQLRRDWTTLATVVGEPTLTAGSVQGDLEFLAPAPDDAVLLAQMLASSPQVQYAQATLARAEAELKRARRETVPDISARGGLSQDNEPLSTPQSRTGLVGFAEIGVQLHVFNRNQGTIDADQAALEQSRQELTRLELTLRDHAAGMAEDYRNARLVAAAYHDQILPRTQQAYLLMTRQYGLMDASYSRVLNLQRELYQAEIEYLNALEAAQSSYVTLNGFLYTSPESEPLNLNTSEPQDLTAPRARSSLFNPALSPE